MNIDIRDELYLILDGDNVHSPMACYALNSNANATICELFAEMKLLDRYLSNIS